MAELTKIEWADHTWNPVEGCQKVGPGCDNCYAEDRNKRWGGGKNWGPGAPRRRTSEATWAKAFKWNRDADKFEAEHDRRQRVFCSSLSDLFDNAWGLGWRLEVFDRMEVCDRLNWLPLTKRVGNVEGMIPYTWQAHGWPRHIGLMITVVNQDEADRDIPKLLALKAKFNIPWVGISYEPALGSIDLRRWMGEAICGSTYVGRGEEFERCDLTGAPCDGLDWVIAGTESGRFARYADLNWFRDLRDQCAGTGTAFFAKQIPGRTNPGKVIKDLDDFPEDLRIREFPEALR